MVKRMTRGPEGVFFSVGVPFSVGTGLLRRKRCSTDSDTCTCPRDDTFVDTWHSCVIVLRTNLYFLTCIYNKRRRDYSGSLDFSVSYYFFYNLRPFVYRTTRCFSTYHFHLFMFVVEPNVCLASC